LTCLWPLGRLPHANPSCARIALSGYEMERMVLMLTRLFKE